MKVMFLYLSIILSTVEGAIWYMWCGIEGGVCLGSVCPARGYGIEGVSARRVAGQTPHHRQADTPPPPCHEMATAAVGTYPTGMHSCYDNICNIWQWYTVHEYEIAFVFI